MWPINFSYMCYYRPSEKRSRLRSYAPVAFFVCQNNSTLISSSADWGGDIVSSQFLGVAYINWDLYSQNEKFADSDLQVSDMPSHATMNC